MAPISSNSADVALDARERRVLLEVARRAIGDGLHGDEPLEQADGHTPALCAPAATFVTLHVARQLRGCIGTLEVCRPLVVDTAQNAYAAAFRDPRFPALTPSEFERLDVHVSILTPPEPLAFDSEEDLVACLRPGVDGLILSDGARRATFLPAVWEAIPDPREFLAQLKLKAGLRADHWSPTVRVSRYATISIP